MNDDEKRELVNLREEAVSLRKQLAELTRDDLASDDELEEPEDITLIEILKNPEITKVINTAVEAWRDDKPRDAKFRMHSLYLAIIYGLLVFAGLGLMAHWGALPKEAAGTLIGALIGYMFGKQAKG
jgi:hypothetical protein